MRQANACTEGPAEASGHSPAEGPGRGAAEFVHVEVRPREGMLASRIREIKTARALADHKSTQLRLSWKDIQDADERTVQSLPPTILPTLLDLSS